MTQTAAIAESADGRASIPAQVTRGRSANVMPEAIATDRHENCLLNITAPAAARPTARPLGARDHNSVGAKAVNQACISR